MSFGLSKMDLIELMRLGKWNGIKFVRKMHRDSCCICTWIKTDVEICYFTSLPNNSQM